MGRNLDLTPGSDGRFDNFLVEAP
ncbi:hypothetical protein NEOLI_005289 [Neolecta irregularis DAH-3]|uniref:Uncharacterized protein n=1 Tax=Neolecta irregularis (strain DAH-3) TaxID=1198029 RepID=A0A1U7LN86_NEOID|nr:hypothetical protein NEOLI_005289 [Neolecta irregularis DAH-3]|eukprot:OLL24088.1 hypothetical protein NEOLI_005289 [Neolecta irregularis DAH-3]